ncbi:MAG: ECF-type sigma factor [Pseudomonadota bacterium]
MSEAVTRLLHEWHNGNAAARDELWPLMYEELRRLALHHMNDQREGHTLQATALVNEAFMKLAYSDYTAANKRQFFALAAKAMRSILIDHARAKSSAKRGAGAVPVSLTEELPAETADPSNILAVDEVLGRLAEKDPRKADIVELKVFGGLSFDEIAEALDLSNATVRADMRFARAWMEAELASDK